MKNCIVFGIMLMALAIALPTLAEGSGSPPADPVWWKELLGYVLPIVGTLLAAVMTWAIGLLAKKLGIDLVQAKSGAVMTSVRAAIAATEEWAARTQKESGHAVPGEKKLQHAKEIIQAQWMDLSDAQVTTLVDTALGGAYNVGASGEKTVLVD